MCAIGELSGKDLQGDVLRDGEASGAQPLPNATIPSFSGDCGEMTEEQRTTFWWDRWFLGLAAYIATASKDPSSQVGCVVIGSQREVLTLGYNGLPRGVEDTAERLGDRHLKYQLVVHAEANAIANASRIGVSLIGSTLYCTFPLCSSCASLVIQSGVRRVVTPHVDVPDRWLESINLGSQLLTEAKVTQA